MFAYLKTFPFLCTFVWLLARIRAEDGPSVIIIGAGPSGIAAATRLLENNITDVKIFEAENRIGGRINSVEFGGSFVDLGARFCHGQEGNVVYEKVKDMDLLQHNELFTTLYHDTHELDKNFTVELLKAFDELLEESDEKGGPKESVGEYCRKRYNESILSKFDKESEKRMAVKAVDFFASNVCAVDGAFSWDDVICNDDYEISAGENTLTWKHTGYRLFLNILMKKYPDPKQQLPIDDKILLNKEVTKISWDKGKVIVQTNNNDTHECDHAIFTPSVGVLKHRSAELFQPALPNDKLKAIEVIGFDAVMKVVMYFEDVWWQDRNGFAWIWDLEDLDKLRKQFPEGPVLGDRPWFTYTSVALALKQNPNVLVAWITGPAVPSIEQMDEDILKRGMDFVLDKFCGHSRNVSKITKIVRTQWYTNPHFRGSYSFQTKNTTTKKEGKSSEQILAEPILNDQGRPILQFAGEATNDRHYSTVHGATESGYREADRLIELYKH